MEQKIKKVTVELEDGTVLEFDKQVLVFVEDEMTENEKKVHASETKLCCVASCSPQFVASAAGMALGTLYDHTPGMDAVVMVRHMESKMGISGALASILGL